MLLPSACPACGQPGPAPCAACWPRLRRAPSGPVPAGIGRCWAFLAYDGPGRELVARLKYRNRRDAVEWLVDGMAQLVAAEVAAGDIDTITWAPTTSRRVAARGFDHAALLASGVARRVGLGAGALLRRAPGPAQTGQAASARRLGPAFEARRLLPGASVLVVDDVITTGATLRAAARALRSAGCRDVLGLAAARTPLKVFAAETDA